ncbi:uncharacterized protein LOC130420976 [Triplophysa dalaica]|uniref:uncharacterized protein LOC130420976 n=1 Tax=Triplophysa dalaica TaxID=1582913 RepID=UPI0024DF3EB5|nr:uncharacterized protein LOC130420976 [Triplophysa dalaica]XP_056604558.1 uncharacterized protein LOC130420976 [Triplophysa dalaica]XP_056604559.1 uncharacterized protein LOC130420976 [Triplophysa dalaica]XP_056604560.1 uncharacterized protein LOC130420976 [Triplophysa dalaica]
MAGVVRCCVLFMIVGFCSHSSLASFDTVTPLIGERGKSINIPCATNKSPQDGVYMIRKKLNEEEHQNIFYYYFKDNKFTIKINISASINKEAIPNITATLNNLTVADTGYYWCRFNLEEKQTDSTATFLFVTEIKEEIIYVCNEKIEHCQNGTVFYVMIALFALTLCIHGFLYVKVKRRHEYTPSKKSPDSSIYEEMTRNRVDTSATLINSAYQSTK